MVSVNLRDVLRRVQHLGIVIQASVAVNACSHRILKRGDESSCLAVQGDQGDTALCSTSFSLRTQVRDCYDILCVSDTEKAIQLRAIATKQARQMQ